MTFYLIIGYLDNSIVPRMSKASAEAIMSSEMQNKHTLD